MFENRQLATYPEHDFLAKGDAAFAPDGRKVAFVTSAKGSNLSVLVADGRASEPFLAILGPVYGATGALAFVGFGRDYRARVSVGAQSFGPYGPGEAETLAKQLRYPEIATLPAFSPDGTRCAFRALTKEGYRIVADGKPSEPFGLVSAPVFGAPDRLAYRISDGMKDELVVDGARGAAYARIDDIVFGPEGALAFTASHGGHGDPWFVVADGTEGPSFESVTRLGFTQDGKLVYAGRKDEASHIMVDHRAVLTVPEPGPRFAVGPNGRLALDRFKKSWFTGIRTRVYCDGRAGPGFDGIDQLGFSPRGKLVYVGGRGTGHEVLLLEHRPVGPVCGKIWPPQFDADERHVAFGARIGRELWWRAAAIG